MNDQSQIEAKIIHLTPPQRFQVAHQLPKDHPAVPNPVFPPSKGEEFKDVTTNPSKIWAIRILNGIWLLVTLFLKRCTRIDKNLLVVYVALVLLLLQVFMVISRAEAGPWHRSPLMTSPSDPSVHRQHTRIAQTYPNHFISNATLPVQAIDRSPVTLAKNPPWQLRLAPTCPGTSLKAAGAAAALFAYFFQLQGKSMTRGSETNIIAVSYPIPPELAYKQNNLIEVSLIQADSFQISTLGNTESEIRSSENGHHSRLLPFAEMRFNHSMNSLCVFRLQSAYPTLSGPGVPQMITSFGS